jgi:WD40 repeat protein
LASGSWDGTARLWSVATGTELATFKGHGEKVHAVAFAPVVPAEMLAPAVEDEAGPFEPIAVG